MGEDLFAFLFVDGRNHWAEANAPMAGGFVTTICGATEQIDPDNLTTPLLRRNDCGRCISARLAKPASVTKGSPSKSTEKDET